MYAGLQVSELGDASAGFAEPGLVLDCDAKAAVLNIANMASANSFFI